MGLTVEEENMNSKMQPKNYTGAAQTWELQPGYMMERGGILWTAEGEGVFSSVDENSTMMNLPPTAPIYIYEPPVPRSCFTRRWVNSDETLLEEHLQVGDVFCYSGRIAETEQITYNPVLKCYEVAVSSGVIIMIPDFARDYVLFM